MTAQAPAGRPRAEEYGNYWDRYIGLIADDDIIAVLESQRESTLGLLGGIPEARSAFRYEAGKWSIKELVGHVIDTERIIGYRALRFARNDRTELPGFDQDSFAANANYNNLSLALIANEFDIVRRSTLALFRQFDEAAWNRRGIANRNEASVRALAFIVAGHERHHMEVLKTRYLQAG
jgi:hypothetical protein